MTRDFFYVTMIRGRGPSLRVARLLGPLVTPPTPVQIDKCRNLACELDNWHWFDNFGTTRYTRDIGPGAFNGQVET